MAFVLSAKSRTRKTPHYRCDIQVRLIQNTELTVNDIARQERVSAAYIYALVRLHVAGARYHRGYCQRSATASAQRHEVDAPDNAAFITLR
jgi:hypothetical protein